MTNHDEIAGAATEPVVAAFSGAETIDLVESWLRAAPDLRFGKIRAQCRALRLEITRRQFSEAKRRVGITASAAPQPSHRRPDEPRIDTRDAALSVALPLAIASPPTVKRRPPMRRRRRSINLADLSNLAEELDTIVAERDRARAALEEMWRIVKALR